MELVEGETLSERIARGPLPVNEALTHTEGHGKVLDFGLAKAFADEAPESVSSASPTLSRDATRAGVILGTAVYMSPEQARGKAVDKRTDIFSFGAVLYEMLTGKKAFTGEDVSEVLASVIKQEPDWKALPADVPPSVVKLLRRCLTKDRKERLQAIGDVRVEIREILAEPGTAVPSEAPKVTIPPLVGALAAIAGVLVIALLATLWILWQSVSAPEPPVRLLVKLGSGDHQLAPYTNSHGSMVVLSPDGKTLAFVGRTPDGNSQIYLRSLNSLEATPLSGTEGAASPFFSPEGQWLAFFARGALKKVSVSGGAALTIAEVQNARGGTWGPDHTIVYTPTGTTGLYRVPASGGTPVELTQLSEGERAHRWPWFLPNGKAVLFTVQAQGESYEDGTLEAVFLDSGERKVLHRGGTYPRYAASGHLLYAREATLFAIPFDLDRIEPTGEPSPVIEGVLTYGIANGASYYAFSGDGSLVYVPGQVSLEEVPRELVRVDREGRASPLTETLGDYEGPRFSPDGQRLAVRRMEATGGADQDVWILELSRGTLSRLTFEGGLLPLWSPDGERVIFGSTRVAGADADSVGFDIFWKPADGTGPAEQLTTGPYRVPTSVTSEGKTIVFRQGGAGDNLDIGMVRLEGEGEPEMLHETSFNEHTPKVSPDDRWLAYVSNESGRDEIYVTRFPTGGKWQISTEGGREPAWSRDSRELFYRNGEKMMAVAVPAGPETAGKPALLFEGRYDSKEGPGASNYDVTPDGQGFVMIRGIEEQQSGIDTITLVQNWFEELKRLVPASD
jgi:serine/threonine-protein kinase